jgi:SAM-dependent methyltransferase
MKDKVENRARVPWSRKLRLARLAMRENGLWWCTLLFLYYTTSKLAHEAFAAMDRLRRQRNIPGMNSAALNKEIWEAWNWSGSGEEWTLSEEWKLSLRRCVLDRYMARGSSILEIGPGAGRWSEYLLELAHDYVGIDISSTCVAHCQSRFGGNPRARFSVGSGRDLHGVADASIDAIWSFDVFVHINRAEVESYAQEFRRVLRPGGIAVVHHGSLGGAQGGWRSDLTAHAMREALQGNGLVLEKSLSHWVDGEAVHQLIYGDLITLIRKPDPLAAALEAPRDHSISINPSRNAPNTI